MTLAIQWNLKNGWNQVIREVSRLQRRKILLLWDSLCGSSFFFVLCPEHGQSRKRGTTVASLVPRLFVGWKETTPIESLGTRLHCSMREEGTLSIFDYRNC